MPMLENFRKLMNRAPTDVVGVDCASNSIRVARVRKSGEYFTLTASAILPFQQKGENSRGNHEHAPFSFPAGLRARFASLTTAAEAGHIKLLRVPDSFDYSDRADMISRMALIKDADLRIASELLLEGSAKVEARILAAAIPNDIALRLLALLPSTGTPAPRSLSVSESAVINAFWNDARFIEAEGARGLIHIDHDFSLIALFNKGILSQFRSFSFGMAAVTRRVITTLNVDEVTAEGILMDGAFDISHIIEDGARDIRSQLVIARDFMERSENCSLDTIYTSGPSSLVKPLANGLTGAGHVVDWDVLSGFKSIDDGAVPEEVAAHSWKLASAVGSALGVLLPA